jgi:hypothetical protein
MARVIEKPREKEIRCRNCYALIGYDNSDIKTITLSFPLDYYKITEEHKSISLRTLTCPYCEKSIYLDEERV